MSRSLSGGWLLLWLLLVEQAGRSLAAAPVFDPATRMRTVLVPSDTAVGTVIYRLRASDDEFDYPLHFELLGNIISNLFPTLSFGCEITTRSTYIEVIDLMIERFIVS